MESILARLTMKVGELLVDSQILVLRLFHRLQRVIVVSVCCCVDNLPSKSNNITVKSLASWSSSHTILSMPILFQQVAVFEQTKHVCMCVSAKRLQDTQVSSQGIPRLIRLVRVGRHWWAKRQRKDWTRCGTFRFQRSCHGTLPCVGTDAWRRSIQIR